MTYAESIQELKEWAESKLRREGYAASDLYDLIDRACQLSLAEGKRQQHEEVKNAIGPVIFDLEERNRVFVTLASLSPGKEGNK